MKYVHTNIIAKDWEILAKFYEVVFDCKQVGPKRELSGEWLSALTGLENVTIEGVHLSLPGYENGPTLEIFSYSPTGESYPVEELNRIGYGHLAFEVNSVEESLEKFKQNGGVSVGEVVEKDYPNMGRLTVVYAKDPEGNFVEICNWKK